MPKLRHGWIVGLSAAGVAGLFAACSAKATNGGAAGAGGSGGATAGGGGAPSLLLGGLTGDPTTCAEAASAQSYIGCDFWPVVTLNPVWSIFDFAATVSNVGAEDAIVSITGPGGVSVSGTVPSLGLQTFYLPWVSALKGGDTDLCSSAPSPTASITVTKGAYHLTSTRPVVVYQFNALEFRGSGGPQGKDWSTCPGDQPCPSTGDPSGCFSFTNDASLLLPTTAMTGNYRITSVPASAGGSFFAVTGTADGTTVKVQLSATAFILAGGSVTAGTPGALISFPVDMGDVVEVVADSSQPGADLSGSQVQADHPIQVIAGAPCAALPLNLGDAGANLTCDHLEESVLPVETLGHHYFVTVPTAALGKPIGHVVRFYGNVDGTHLTYPSGAPPNAPATLAAGQVADLGTVSLDFEVTADHEFAVGTFSLSGELQDPDEYLSRGDPAQSQAVAVEQYRKSYVFLAPNDYDVSFIDVVLPAGAQVKLDGAPLPGTPSPLGSSSFGVARVRLGAGRNGAHVVTSDQPIGIQIMGYGAYTAYQYPGGLNLQHIAPPLPPLK